MSAMDELRATAGSGPWDGEPDSVDWEHEGVACKMRRSDSFTWCGYAEVPKGHPWYMGVDTALGGVRVHGGITFANLWSEIGGWWIGFDCNHYLDLAPIRFSRLSTSRTYRDLAYVKLETERLAEQIAAVGRYPACSQDLLSELTDSYFDVGADRGTSLFVYLTHTIAGALGEKARLQREHDRRHGEPT